MPKPDYQDLTVPELRAQADKRGLDYPTGAAKNDLINLLERDDTKRQRATTKEEEPVVKEAERKDPLSPGVSLGPDEPMPGIEKRLAGAHPEPDVETDKLGVPAGYMSNYTGRISAPLIPGDPHVPEPPPPYPVPSVPPEEKESK